MSIPYLIKFKPYGRFYFGTPQSFGESFYAISSMFPTQTTILGTLRAAILQQNDLLDLEKRKPKLNDSKDIPDEVKQLTGTSKIVDLFDEDDNLGKILKISPVFIVRQGKGSECVEDFLLPVPSDVIFDYDEVEKEKDGTPK
jgi:CRISPR type III-B/RAMP module-associated protein Cmr3